MSGRVKCVLSPDAAGGGVGAIAGAMPLLNRAIHRRVKRCLSSVLALIVPLISIDPDKLGRGARWAEGVCRKRRPGRRQLPDVPRGGTSGWCSCCGDWHRRQDFRRDKSLDNRPRSWPRTMRNPSTSFAFPASISCKSITCSMWMFTCARWRNGKRKGASDMWV